MLLAAPQLASLEIINDINGFVANFWRAIIHDAVAVAHVADYPPSHVDLGARQLWLMAQRERLAESLQDAHWPGDPQVAGWWLGGQCVGLNWCDWFGPNPKPVASPFENGVVQGAATRPHVANYGRGIHAVTAEPQYHEEDEPQFWTPAGRAAYYWLKHLSKRLARVRVMHVDWHRSLYLMKDGPQVAIFLDPPYDKLEACYNCESVAQAVGLWAREHAHCRIALCGDRGEYDLPDWESVKCSNGGGAFIGRATTVKEETILFSPACLKLDGDAGPSLFKNFGVSLSEDITRPIED